MFEDCQAQIVDVELAKQPIAKNYNQVFQYGEQKIVHEHKVEVQLASSTFKELEILNYFTRNINNQLVKVTQIYYNNRIIKITNSFESSQVASIDSEFNQKKEKKIPHARKFSLRCLKQQKNQEDASSKNPKNSIKNIVRLFQSWLQQKLALYRQNLRQLMELVNSVKFNNTLMLKIIKSTNLRKCFMSFCINDAEQFLTNSKIKDKITHARCLETYFNLCEEMETKQFSRSPEELMAIVN